MRKTCTESLIYLLSLFHLSGLFSFFSFLPFRPSVDSCCYHRDFSCFCVIFSASEAVPLFYLSANHLDGPLPQKGHVQYQNSAHKFRQMVKRYGYIFENGKFERVHPSNESEQLSGQKAHGTSTMNAKPESTGTATASKEIDSTESTTATGKKRRNKEASTKPAKRVKAEAATEDGKT